MLLGDEEPGVQFWPNLLRQATNPNQSGVNPNPNQLDVNPNQDTKNETIVEKYKVLASVIITA